jgi:hypothetical protein
VSNNDRAAELFALLRASTSEMLGFSTPTPVQQLKVDLAASLRMEIDRIVSQQLAGHPADVRALTALTESLRSLFPAAADSAYDFSGAKAELEAFLSKRAAALERRAERLAATEAATMADIYANEEAAAIAAASPDVGKGLPKSGGTSTGSASKSGLADNVIPIRDPELERLSSRELSPKTPEREAELAASAKAFRDSYTGSVIAPAWSPPR